MAYLAFHDPRRFRPDRMLVVVFNTALARYISQVLPALGVQGVAIRAYEDWAARLRSLHFPRLPRRYAPDTPGSVVRLKKHPAMLRYIDDYVNELCESVQAELHDISDGVTGADAARAAWEGTAGRPFAHRVHALQRWLEGAPGRALPVDTRVRLERAAARATRSARDVSGAWADLLSDRARLKAALSRHAPGAFNDNEIERAHAWCAAHCAEALTAAEEQAERDESGPPGRDRPARRHAAERDERRAATTWAISAWS
jgi:DNA helicase-2/ATP-dependent DNA helicase PcrA